MILIIINLRFADLIWIHAFFSAAFSFPIENRHTLEHQSPAFSDGFRSANGMIDAFINMGAPRSKISLILSTFSDSFKRVKCQSEVEAGCPANGLGSIIYSENTIFVEGKNILPHKHDLPTICKVVADPEWTKKYDSVAQVAYAYNSEQWMSYEDEQSIKVKVFNDHTIQLFHVLNVYNLSMIKYLRLTW